MDSAARAHLAFAEATNVFPSYAQSANSWVVERVALDASRGLSLALDGSGAARLAYGNPSTLRYASRASGTWSVMDVPGAGPSNEPVLGHSTDSGRRTWCS